MIKTFGKLGLTAVAAMAACFAAAQQQISVVLNGQPVPFNDTAPRQVNGRVLVPMRAIFEDLGAYVHWTDATQTVEATKGNTDVILQIGNRTAQVNGQNVNLDVPPMLIGGSTMVPLRFVSEALGADVNWRDQDQTVIITTAGTQATTGEHYDNLPRNSDHRDHRGNGGGYTDQRTTVVTTQRRVERHGLHSRFAMNQVIPVTLDNPLSSDGSQPGDRFSCTVQTNDPNGYNGLPAGTKIMGHVVVARAQNGDNPGVLQLAFDAIQAPDGSAQNIDGRVIGLDNASVTRQQGGVLVANPSKAGKPGDTAAYVGYGAGAGAAIALISHGNLLTDTAVGGALGYLFHQIQGDRNHPRNVNLNAGTQMGVRLNQAVNLQ